MSAIVVTLAIVGAAVLLTIVLTGIVAVIIALRAPDDPFDTDFPESGPDSNPPIPDGMYCPAPGRPCPPDQGPTPTAPDAAVANAKEPQQ